MPHLSPESEDALCAAIAEADRPLEIVGGGTRGGLGRPVQAGTTLSTRALGGVKLYEPGALTLVVGAGMAAAEVEALLAAEGQRLPFEPMDHRALLGSAGTPTIGGMVACAASGPRRIQAGACRDAMIGVRFVDGTGRTVQNGGRVMKNVTGLDLVKLMAGSFGTLGVISEVGFKVLPRPERAITVEIAGLDDAGAVAAMAAALATPFDVTGAAHRDGHTWIRVEGLGAQAAARADGVAAALARRGGAITRHEGPAHDALWQAVRDVTDFAGQPGAVWRLSLKPSDAPGAVAAIRARRPAEVLYDWAGGLVWLLTPETDEAGIEVVRAQTARLGGHATLVRASPTLRAACAVFEPEPPVLAGIARGLRARFDPRGILNPGRMG